MFNGNAPSPFENPMLKAAGVASSVVNPIQQAAANQANNAAASDPLAIVSAPSAATLKRIDALKTDSRAPINTPVQPVKAPTPIVATTQPTGMFGVPTSTYVNPMQVAAEKAQEASAARMAPLVTAKETAEKVKAEQVSNSILDNSFRSTTYNVLMGTDIRNDERTIMMNNPLAEPQRDLMTGEYEIIGASEGIEGINAHDQWLADNAIRDKRKGLDTIAKDYTGGSVLPFDMMQAVGKEDGIKMRDYLNAFITTPEFTQGYEEFKKAAEDAGQTEDEGYFQKAWANAHGIEARGKNIEMGNDGLFKYNDHEASSLSKLVKATVVGGLTFGIGTTLAPAFAGLGNLSVPATNAIAQATVNGVAAAAQGGDLSDVLTSATLGGVGKYATGLSEAAEAATAADTIGGLGDISGFSDTLGSVGTVSAETASLAAKAEVANRVVSGLQGIQAIDEGNVLGGVAGVAGASGMFSGDTLSKIETGADTIKAVEDKDILGAVSGGLKLADLKAPQDYAETLITEQFGESEWVSQNIAPLATASIKLVDELANGEAIEDAISSSVVKFAKEGGGLSQILPEGLDIESGDFKVPMDFLEPLLEAGRQIDKEVLQPIKDDVTTLVRETGRTIREAAPDIDLPDVDMSGFELPSLNLDIDFSGFDMPDIDIDIPSLSLPDFNFPKWEASSDSSDSLEGLDVDKPELNFAFNANAGREAQRTANAKRTEAEDFERLDISNYFSNPLLR